ncbi:Adhesion G-protein coupled receptor D2 [Takifugu flavidus]|uniref:Adhesion G-protein coupled receptor D2 n=1 Tax=Takifugu flavidus TaxID=433684 RepID=A0A5C6N179_9TELE|nr:Adhesion G-protein coupled receptor D2 [Takifugu flavidus]
METLVEESGRNQLSWEGGRPLGWSPDDASLCCFRAVTRPVLILLPVLGLTWLCGVLVHLSVVVAYIFITLNAFQGLYIFLVYAVYNSEVRNAIKRIQEKRKALSFMVRGGEHLQHHCGIICSTTECLWVHFQNCSQPTSFLPSQRAPMTSWVSTPPNLSSPETSETSGTPSSRSLVIRNESFRNDLVSFSLKPEPENQVVQLTSFKPSGTSVMASPSLCPACSRPQTTSSNLWTLWGPLTESPVIGSLLKPA